jgi:hypothetical protein
MGTRPRRTAWHRPARPSRIDAKAKRARARPHMTDVVALPSTRSHVPARCELGNRAYLCAPGRRGLAATR